MKTLICILGISLLAAPALAAISEPDRAVIDGGFIGNGGAENGVVGLSSYADSAATSPVDMTGGSPNTTCTRSTSSPLAGNASFLMTVSSGATRQGEGCAFQAITIPLGKRGKTLTATFDYATTGTLVDGDFPLYAYQIDGASPKVLTPSGVPAASLLGASGTAQVTFTPDSDATQIRFGIHVGRASNTGAVTVKFDSVRIAAERSIMGFNGSNAVAYTPVFTSFGTVTTQDFTWASVGDKDHIVGKFTCATSTAAEARISLPAGHVVDSTKNASIRKVGAGAYGATNTANQIQVLAEAGASYLTLGNQSSGTGGLSKVNGSSICGGGDVISIEAWVPIAGRDANVTMGQSSTWKMSSILASGTRVTATPTKLGEWRSQTRTASSSTFSDTAPGALPSVADGIRLYSSAGYANNDAASSPTRYQIFVGKNKNVYPYFFSSTGMTGFCDTTPWNESSTVAYGAMRSYDPTTGIFEIGANVIGSTTTHNTGRNTLFSPLSTCYMDLVVSENALAAGIQAPRSEVWLTGANGYGSTNTVIRRFTNTRKNTGSAITYTDSSTAGASFTINEDGVYAITYGDNFTVAGIFGISRNSSQLTTNIQSITDTDRIAGAFTSAADFTNNAVATLNLVAGDVIRAHTAGGAVGTSGITTSFRITKVSN